MPVWKKRLREGEDEPTPALWQMCAGPCYLTKPEELGVIVPQIAVSAVPCCSC